jgi:hypothetical protein
MEVSDQPQTLAILIPEMTTIPMNRRLGGPQTLCGHFWIRYNLLQLPGPETRTVQRVAQLLYRLSYPNAEMNEINMARNGTGSRRLKSGQIAKIVG